MEKIQKSVTPITEVLQDYVKEIPEEERDTVSQFVKESSELVGNQDMGFAEKLMKLNELKAKYGNGSSNK